MSQSTNGITGQALRNRFLYKSTSTLKSSQSSSQITTREEIKDNSKNVKEQIDYLLKLSNTPREESETRNRLGSSADSKIRKVSLAPVPKERSSEKYTPRKSTDPVVKKTKLLGGILKGEYPERNSYKQTPKLDHEEESSIDKELSTLPIAKAGGFAIKLIDGAKGNGAGISPGNKQLDTKSIFLGHMKAFYDNMEFVSDESSIAKVPYFNMSVNGTNPFESVIAEENIKRSQIEQKKDQLMRQYLEDKEKDEQSPEKDFTPKKWTPNRKKLETSKSPSGRDKYKYHYRDFDEMQDKSSTLSSKKEQNKSTQSLPSALDESPKRAKTMTNSNNNHIKDKSMDFGTRMNSASTTHLSPNKKQDSSKQGSSPEKSKLDYRGDDRIAAWTSKFEELKHHVSHTHLPSNENSNLANQTNNPFSPIKNSASNKSLKKYENLHPTYNVKAPEPRFTAKFNEAEEHKAAIEILLKEGKQNQTPSKQILESKTTPMLSSLEKRTSITENKPRNSISSSAKKAQDQSTPKRTKEETISQQNIIPEPPSKNESPNNSAQPKSSTENYDTIDRAMLSRLTKIKSSKDLTYMMDTLEKEPERIKDVVSYLQNTSVSNVSSPIKNESPEKEASKVDPEEREKLLKYIEEYENIISELKKKLEKANNSVEKSHSEIERIKIENISLSKTNEKLEKQLQSSSLSTNPNRRSSEFHQVGLLKAQLDQANQTIAQNQLEIQSLQKRIQELTSIQQQQLSHISMQQQHLQKLQAQISSSQATEKTEIKAETSSNNLPPPSNILLPPKSNLLLPPQNNILSPPQNNLLPPPSNNLLKSSNNLLGPPPSNLLHNPPNNLLSNPPNIQLKQTTSLGPPPILTGISNSNNLGPPPMNLIKKDDSKPSLSPPPLKNNLGNPPTLSNNLNPPPIKSNLGAPGGLGPPLLNAPLNNNISQGPKITPPVIITASQQQGVKKKMKPVFIESIPEGKSSMSIYKDVFDQKLPAIQFDDLEDLFENVTQVKEPTTPNSAEEKAKVKNFCIIEDPNKARNISIMLNKFKKISMNDLRDALISMNPDIVTFDTCQTLKDYCPDNDEIDLCKGYEGSVEDLDMASQYLVAMSAVPRMKIRLNTFKYREEFIVNLSSFSSKVDIFKKGCECIRNSSSFKSFLGIAVALANNMNQGTNRGNSVGLKPKSLIALNNVKANKSNLTLLTYILKKIYDYNPSFLNFASEFAILSEVVKINIDETVKSLSAMKGEMTALKNNLETSKKTNDKGFVDAFEKFYEENAPLIEQADKNANATKAYFIETAIYMGEDENKIKRDPPEEFFNNYKIIGELTAKFKADVEGIGKKDIRTISPIKKVAF